MRFDAGFKSLMVRWASFDGLIVLYWLVFWLGNGLDKFATGTTMPLLTWHGKDRYEQFTEYFWRLGFGLDMVPDMLHTVGIWELLIAAVFLVAALFFLWRFNDDDAGSDRYRGIIRFGLYLSALTFIAFSLFDIIVGDRAELREHALYFVVVVLSLIAVSHMGDRVNRG